MLNISRNMSAETTVPFLKLTKKCTHTINATRYKYHLTFSLQNIVHIHLFLCLPSLLVQSYSR